MNEMQIKISLIGLFNAPYRDDGFVPKEITDPHFHGACKLRRISIPARSATVGGIELAYVCKNHGVTVCKCGWQFGWHGGESAVEINATADRIASDRKAEQLKKARINRWL